MSISSCLNNNHKKRADKRRRRRKHLTSVIIRGVSAESILYNVHSKQRKCVCQYVRKPQQVKYSDSRIHVFRSPSFHIAL